MPFDLDQTESRASPADVTCFGMKESADCCIDSVKTEPESLPGIISAFTGPVSALIHHSGITGNTILLVELGNFCRLLTSPLLKGRVDSVHGYPLAPR